MSSSVLREIVGQARMHPERTAAKDLARELSYAELVGEAARLGAGLSDAGVVEGDRVALLIGNSVDFVVAALAALWVGAVFVPLAVTDPLSRLETIVSDCEPALIVTSASGDSQYPAAVAGVEVVPFEALLEEQAISMVEGDDTTRVAYTIYTSGTTGTPKGVQIGNSAFVAAVRSIAEAIGLNHATRTLCVSPFHFDGAYANLFPTLVSGGTVVIRPRDLLLHPRTFFNAVASEEVTYSGFTPSYLRLLLASPQVSTLADSTLKCIALGGEAIPVTALRALWACAPDLRVFNRYGPTETTIAVTDVELTKDVVEHGAITIGRPHPGVSFVLVDEHDRVIEEANCVGELYIGGDQLMTGYWANPALTSEVMRTDIVPGETLYRSGDLAYRDDVGDYFYVDRVDRVVKRSGVRISLIELSESMGKLDGVTAAACLMFDNDGELGIAAFLVTDQERAVIDVRRAANRLIPDNMLPDRIEFVSALPLGRSNQLDEHRLLSESGLKPFRTVFAAPPDPE